MDRLTRAITYFGISALSLALLVLSQLPSTTQSTSADDSLDGFAASFGNTTEVSSAAEFAQSAITIFYLGNWAAEDTLADIVWSPQTEVNQWFDLRPVSLSSKLPILGGAGQCCLLAITDEPLKTLPLGWAQISASKDSLAISLGVIESHLVLPRGSLSATTVADLIFELLVEDAVNPLYPNRNNVWTLEFEGQRIYNKPFDGFTGEAGEAFKQKLIDDYAQIRSDLKEREPTGEKYLMWLWEKSKIYRFDYKEILNGLPDEGIVKPATAITEDFNCADADELDCDINWTEGSGDTDIVSNETSKIGNNNGFANADTGLASTDHYVQAVVGTTRNNNQGLLGRWDGAAGDGFRFRYEDSTPDRLRVYDCVSHSCSQICTENVSTEDLSSGETMRAELNGSDLDVIVDGTTFNDACSDASHSDHTQFGMYTFQAGTNWDDFEADILGAAAARRRLIN